MKLKITIKIMLLVLVILSNKDCNASNTGYALHGITKGYIELLREEPEPIVNPIKFNPM